jgi:hypothetical protein
MKTKKTTTQGWFTPDPEKHKNMFLPENKKDEEIKSLIKAIEAKHTLAEHLAAIRHSYYKTKLECYKGLKDKIPKSRTNFYRLIRHGEISAFLKGEGITPIPTRPYIYRLLEKVPKEHLIPLWESACKAADNASNLKQDELIKSIDTYNTNQKTNINISAEKREQENKRSIRSIAMSIAAGLESEIPILPKLKELFEKLSLEPERTINQILKEQEVQEVQEVQEAHKYSKTKIHNHKGDKNQQTLF